MKSSWEKPKLTVLVRGKPEENVLGLCKTDIPPPVWGTPNEDLRSCKWDTAVPGPCDRCSELGLDPS